MDRERLDLILDRQLREALAVKPSADFDARVRARLAEQPRPTPFLWRWPAFAGAVAATLVVAIGVMFMRPATPEVRTPAAPVPRAAATTRPAPLPAHAPLPGAETRVAVRRAATAAAPREVEVIVPPGQAEAIERFARNLSEMSVSSRQLLRVVEVFEGELPQVPSYDVKGNER